LKAKNEKGSFPQTWKEKSGSRVYKELSHSNTTGIFESVTIFCLIVHDLFWGGIGVALPETMEPSKSLSDQLEDRLIEFAARIINFSTGIPRTPAGRHIAMQILRSGTAAAPNYAEARAAESRADFNHKLGIVQKELNETSVWLRILGKVSLGKGDQIVATLQENVELARIVNASIRTARRRSEASPN
jgi:four helix bundle protein